MRLYIASGLPNFENVRVFGKALTDAGHVWTYDWTVHGSVKDRPEVWQATALAEMEGVTSADVVILLHPGGRGTHVELGMALAKGIPVIMLGEDPNPEKPCVLYSHPLVYSYDLESFSDYSITLARTLLAMQRAGLAWKSSAA